jgi:cell wall assembly regulator SMI1
VVQNPQSKASGTEARQAGCPADAETGKETNIENESGPHVRTSYKQHTGPNEQDEILEKRLEIKNVRLIL